MFTLLGQRNFALLLVGWLDLPNGQPCADHGTPILHLCANRLDGCYRHDDAYDDPPIHALFLDCRCVCGSLGSPAGHDHHELHPRVYVAPAAVPTTYWLVYWSIWLLFWKPTVSPSFYPAENALLPQVVNNEQLLAANTLNSLNNMLASLIGPALGRNSHWEDGDWGGSYSLIVSLICWQGFCVFFVAAPSEQTHARSAGKFPESFS